MREIRIAVGSKCRGKVGKIINSYELKKSVGIVGIEDTIQNTGIRQFLMIERETITSYPEWYNQALPFVFPPVPLSKENLLGLVFFHLGLLEDALNISHTGEVCEIIKGLTYETCSLSWLDSLPRHTYSAHNKAILSYYLQIGDSNQVQEYFKKALDAATNDRQAAFTLKQFTLFRQDQQLGTDVGTLQLMLESRELREVEKKAIEFELVKNQLTVAHAEGRIVSASSKAKLEALYRFYDDQKSSLITADLLGEMSWVATLDGHFTEALNYINKAIRLYEEQELTTLMTELMIKKASILHQWAKTGMPHFYQEAIKSYQETLKTTNSRDAPYWFAEIHHQLGILYAEMPEEKQKRAIWAAVSASSFHEALSFFKKDTYPYEYATVCHNYGTALVNYPTSLKIDNMEKAIHYFNEAMEVRTAEALPLERSKTLLNYLEASWEASNINNVMERVRLADMKEKAEELLKLTVDPLVVERAKEHLQTIQKLREQPADA